jgi:acyl-CoA thioester hydrolase
MTEFHTKRRVEFSDVDQAGFVHFSRFFVFMETAEHEFLRSLGTSVHTRVDDKEIGWPRLTAQCEYLSPARFEELLDIHLKVVRKGRKSMTYEFTFKHHDKLVARGKIVSACCVVEAGKRFRAIPIPESIASQVQEISASKG